METSNASTGDLQRAASLALQMRGEVLLRPEDLEAIWLLLQQHAFESPRGELMLNYDDFSQVAADCREVVGPHTDTYFQASAFLRLARDEGACVPLPAVYQYLAARSRQLHLRVQLGYQDTSQSGALSEAQLHQFLLRLCSPEVLRAAGAAPLDWVVVAARRIWLAHSRRGRVPIKDLVASTLMDELAQVVQLLAGPLGPSRSPTTATAAGPRLGPDAGGWFAPSNVLRLRRGFTELDADEDGVLSEQEFAGFCEGTMAALFIKRLFAQHCCNGSASGGRGAPRGMDFAAFVTFVAAWEDRASPAAAKYFFPLLDLQGRGYCDQLDLYTLFREVYQLWLELGQYTELRPEDMVAEITDLLRPADPDRITAADLERCGAAGTVVGLLADVNLLWEYENREALAQQAQQAQQQEEGPV